MTLEQALQIVAQAAALAPMPKAQHLQVEQALLKLSELTKEQGAKSNEH